MTATIQIRVSPHLSLRNPEDTPLGQKIIEQSVLLIDKIGIEEFTFKKLAVVVRSTEASIYRYFKSKRQLMSYLFAWYWAWLEYRMRLSLRNLSDPRRRLVAVIETLAEEVEDDPDVPHIDERALHRLVLAESDRGHLAQQLKAGEIEGATDSYESLVKYIAGLVGDAAPKFKYPVALTETLIGTTHRQRFYVEMLPQITDIKIRKKDAREISKFLLLLVFRTLELREP